MYTSGFTLVYRDEEQDWLFEDRVRYTWWLQLRLKATPFPCVQSVGRTRVTVNLIEGEFATTKVYLSRLWEADERAVDSFLNLLEQDGRITMRRESTILIIRINQYERFSPPAGYFHKKKQADNSEQLPSEMPTEMRTMMQVEAQIETPSQTLVETGSEMQTETQTNKINNINLKTENFNDIYTGRDLEIELLERLKNCSEEDRYFLAKNITCTEAELMRLIDQFEGHILASEEYHSNYARLKAHFSNWAKKEFRNDEIKKSRISVATENKSQSRAAARRGTDVQPRSASDYEAPFPVFQN